MNTNFAILGGTGTTGLKIAELLLEHTKATIILLARNKNKIDESVEKFKQKYQVDRISGEVADAGNEKSLLKAFVNIGMVILACLKQYIDGELTKSGLHCMGNVVEPIRIIEDMKNMGIEIEEL